MDQSNNTGMKWSGANGFSLIEAVVSVLILAMIVGGALLAYSNTTDKLLDASERAAAVAVAERQMEYLLDSRIEPNAHELHGQDELDPRFTWHLVLSREPVESIGGRSGSMSTANSVIKATMRVDSEMFSREEPVELIRYLGALDPLPGSAMAVAPLSEEEPWIKELREKLGREPTLEELIQEMIRRGEMSPATAEDLGIETERETGADKEPPGIGALKRKP